MFRFFEGFARLFDAAVMPCCTETGCIDYISTCSKLERTDVSKKKRVTTMPIRIDQDVHEWIMALKDAYGSPNVSEVLRVALQRAYPNIEELAEAAKLTADERASKLSRFVDDNER